MNKALSPLFHLSLCTLGCLYASSTQAQVTPDDTVNTQVNPNGNVAEITGGETRGGNLFHSFRDFSVSAGNEAFFNNATDISNIFSRVTGGKISKIDGLIRANGSANLFLINPAGIVFGENGSLNIGGSFYGSTASSILFEDGEFSATNLDKPPLLTINAPIGLGFRDNPKPIENNSKADAGLDPAGVDGYFGLRVPNGKSFALAGGDIKANGGGIVTFGGQIELAAVGGEGIVGLNFNGNNLSLSVPDSIPRANVSLTNGAGFLVSGSSGGDMAITAKNIEILEESGLYAGILSNLGSEDTQAGNLTLNATDAMAINSSFINNTVGFLGIGDAGNTIITTSSLSLTNGAEINSSTFGQGNAGNVTVNAADNISLDASGTISSNVEQGAIGNGGQIKVDTGTLNLTNGGQLLTIIREARNNLVAGEGDAGNITVNARDAITLDGISSNGQFPSAIYSFLNEGTTGKAGNIDVTSGSIALTKGAEISSSTSSNGDGGSVNITAQQLSVRDGAGLDTDTFNTGKAGNLTINVKNFTVQNSQVSSSTLGKGNAGNLTVNASESVELSGELPEVNGNPGAPGGLFAQVDIAEGKGGNLTINTQRLSVSDGSKIQVATFGKGDAGELTIRASQIDVMDTAARANVFFTGIFAGIQQDRFRSKELAVGNAGKLTIKTDRLSIIGSGRVEANNSGIGNAGDVSITAKDLVEVVGVNNGIPSFIGAEVAPPDGTNPITPELVEGNGGNVTINTGQLIVKDGGRVSAATYGKGDSGDLAINASDSILLSGEGSGLFAQADPKATGKGGVLNIQTGNLDLSDRAEISASTAFNEGGNINLKIDDTLTMRNNSLISAQALNNANGGNVNINANSIVAFPNENSLNGNNDIRANAAQGNGGDITINAESVLGIEERPLNKFTNDINASSEFELDGSININTSDINPVQGATELPSNVVEAKQTADQTCSVNRDGKANNGLTFMGRGNVAPAPDSPLNSHNIIDGETNSAHNIPEPIETSQGKIQPARGIKVTKDGRIILTAYRTNDAGERIPEIKSNCSNALTNLD